MTDLQTFHIPETVVGNQSDIDLGMALIQAWRKDGILQIATNAIQNKKAQTALAENQRFCSMPLEYKAKHISDLTYSGYIASYEEITANEKDGSEIFTVCKDLPLDDPRVKANWPCHGSAPWPDEEYAKAMKEHMAEAGLLGEKLLQLVALGLGRPIDTFTKLTQDGWHHMRVLRFPVANEQSNRGIGSHTDYGLLVIAVQNDVAGLYVRPPVEGEIRKRNWLESESAAGMYQNEEPWTLVPVVPNVFTVFPCDLLQFMTDGYLLSTPHKIKLHETRERFALAYFHEPNFNICVRPLDESSKESIHYGTHFTNMFMRCYPERITTKRIIAENRYAFLTDLKI